MIEHKVIGWRLDLVRNRLWWRGNDFLASKSELFALIAKACLVEQLLSVTIYTDRMTFDGYYLKWLEEEGVKPRFLRGVVDFCIVGVTRDCYRNYLDDWDIHPEDLKHDYLKPWLYAVNDEIKKVYQANPALYPDMPPDWLTVHQQRYYDGIVAVWAESSKHTENLNKA